MGEKDVNDYLTSGIYGTPQTKPEERNRYLGSLRERVYLSMSIEELSSLLYIDALKEELELHPDGQVLLNGEVNSHALGPYLKLCGQESVQFTIVTNQFAKKSDTGLLFVAANAVNQEVIAVSEKYPLADPTPKEEESVPTEKKSLLKRFFS
ncbi:YueI family protein [Carnobacterium maltaromaticum]|uniref:YueI family protein n=1 Tax=Carnobacterium maltaromaticum TaxID=2751 RepID=UPI00298BC2FD|nr:YueI family protein [Carnobacterium maltaromaticum]MDW5522300.1 YueI family protein [Carnobacterium maltaromaticum]